MQMTCPCINLHHQIMTMWNCTMTLTKPISDQGSSKYKCIFYQENKLVPPPPPPPPGSYHNTQSMEVVWSYKYLGVVVSSDLSWSSHIQLVCMKARKILELIYWKFAKYTSDSSVILIKMYTEGSCSTSPKIWRPSMVTQYDKRHSITRKGAKVCSTYILT